MVDEVKKNEEVFDELDETPESQELKEINTEDVFGELSGEIKYEKVLRPEDEGKVFTIMKAEERKPYIRDAMGNQIKPKQVSQTDSTKIGYPSSLSVFIKDTSYVVNVSGLTYYVSKVNGKNIYTPWFNQKVTEEQLDDQYTSAVSKLFFKYCKFKKLDITKVTAKSFKEGLAGMKVKLKTKKGKYLGKEFTKIEIIDFIE